MINSKWAEVTGARLEAVDTDGDACGELVASTVAGTAGLGSSLAAGVGRTVGAAEGTWTVCAEAGEG